MSRLGWVGVAFVIYSSVIALLSLVILIPSGEDYLIKLDNTNLKPYGLYRHELERHAIETNLTNSTLQETTLPQYFYLYNWGYESEYTNGTTITVHKTKNHDISRMYIDESKAVWSKNGTRLFSLDPRHTWLSFPRKRVCGNYYESCDDEYVTDHRLEPAIGERTRILKAGCAMAILLFICCVSGACIDRSFSAEDDEGGLVAAYIFAFIFWIITIALTKSGMTAGESRLSDVVTEFAYEYEKYGIVAELGPAASSLKARAQDASMGLLFGSLVAVPVLLFIKYLVNW